MADNIKISPATEGTLFDYALDDIAGVLHQRVKVEFGDDGVATDVSASNPLPVTMPGLGTESTLAALKASIDALSAKVSACNTNAVALDAATLSELENINAVVTQPVSAAALPLPAGAATEAAQTLVKASVDAIVAALFATGAAFSLGDKGLLLLAKRRDADTATVADGQLTTLNQDEAGRLKVAVQPASVTPVTGSITANAQNVNIECKRFSNLSISMVATTLVGHNVSFEASNNTTNGSDGNWYGVQVVRSNANTAEVASGVLAATPAYMWHVNVGDYSWFRVRATAHTSGTAAYVLRPGAYATEPIPAGQITGTQPVSGTVTATVVGGTVNPVVPATPYFLNSAATTNGALVLTGTSNVSSFYATNEGASVAYVKLYNKATAPTVGTDVPEMIIPIPAAASGVPGVANPNIGFHGFRFALGLGIAITGAAVYTDTTVVAAGQVKVKLSRTV